MRCTGGASPTDERLQATIGISFRLASANMAFTSDVMTKAGYIAPKRPPLTPTTSLTEFGVVAMRSTFKHYIDGLFYPYFKAREPDITLDDLIEITSLRSIEPYLRANQKIGLMHNEDDIIMASGEIDYLEQVFGDRAAIYPRGGHCGNMEYRDNVAHMIDFFSQCVDGMLAMHLTSVGRSRCCWRSWDAVPAPARRRSRRCRRSASSAM